jgi:hypothetical protein
VPRCHSSGSPRQWREVFTNALARQEAIRVRGNVISHLRRTPTGAEINAARRTAHRLAASGTGSHPLPQTTQIQRCRGSRHLILARPGTATPSGVLDRHRGPNLADRDRQRFEPAVMAHDLAISVKPYRASWFVDLLGSPPVGVGNRSDPLRE